MSGASGIEDGVSIGDMRTMAGGGQGKGQSAVGSGSGQADVASLGEVRTMGPQATGGSEASHGKGTPLLDRYELLEEIGLGGFARVWKARDRKLGRLVAVKRLLSDAHGGADGARVLERFRREAVGIARLNHRNIVQVYDHDTDAEGHYVVMELVPGGSLRDYLKARGGKLPADEAVRLVKGIAQGLGYAHKMNLVHRDIKPANVLLAKEGEEWVPKIVDFGLARLGDGSELSMSGYGMGTPYYMPPEQRRDAKSVNHTADIYAMGKTLYEMLTGALPDVVDPDKVPAELLPVLMKCVKTNPEERWFSAEEFSRALENLEGVGSSRRSGVGSFDNVCESCGAANAADVKFCESCGAGLTRACAECERENSVHRQFCGGCGTDVEGFNRYSSCVEQMERFAKEKQWDLLLKEYGLLPQDIRMPGNKGCDLVKRAVVLKDGAEQALEEMKRLNGELDAACSDGRWSDVLKVARLYLEFAPQDLRMKELVAEMASRVIEDEWQMAKERAEKLERRINFSAAAGVFRNYVVKHVHTSGSYVSLARDELQRLIKLSKLNDDRLSKLKIRDFDGASELITTMTQTGMSEEVGQILRSENSVLMTQVNEEEWRSVEER
ncbi:MAG: protein kinase, partial [Lentisphaerae bacterium]|nr:protein kinase [Lentisphaerota bacterium]